MASPVPDNSSLLKSPDGVRQEFHLCIHTVLKKRAAPKYMLHTQVSRDKVWRNQHESAVGTRRDASRHCIATYRSDYVLNVV